MRTFRSVRRFWRNYRKARELGYTRIGAILVARSLR
jgi:hypothetical protein